MFSVTELNIYPVKSLGGYSVDSVEISGTGFEFDRRWMLIDENNKFITQREVPGMALLAARISNSTLDITHKPDAGKSLQLPLLPDRDKFEMVNIFDDYCNAQLVSKTADEWFSGILNKSCRLVYMPEDTKRLVAPRYAKNGETTSFTDGYPTLIIGEQSLADLNNRLKDQLPMNRFRPNIVFSGGLPYEEDLFEHFNIGSVEFVGVKGCGRCTITTIDQQTSQQGYEPLKTLASYRSIENKIYFGRYLLHRNHGIIKKGDLISIRKKAGIMVPD